MNLQWYPGHMVKSKRMMEENISLVDIVIELLDARVPYSSKNPDIDRLAVNKKRIILLNKYDLADDKSTAKWVKYFEEKGYSVILTNSISGNGISEITTVSRNLMAEKIERLKQRGRIFVPIRAMIVGIPNVGKSTLINKYVGKSMAKTGDKPGVTRGKQWVRIKKDLELLDTPGILWPKFEDKEVGYKLAYTGAINDEIIDRETLCASLITELIKINPNTLKNRYKLEDITLPPHEILREIGKNRGFLAKGGEIDMMRTSIIFLDEFRGSKLGRITLELPEDIVE